MGVSISTMMHKGDWILIQSLPNTTNYFAWDFCKSGLAHLCCFAFYFNLSSQITVKRMNVKHFQHFFVSVLPLSLSLSTEILEWLNMAEESSSLRSSRPLSLSAIKTGNKALLKSDNPSAMSFLWPRFFQFRTIKCWFTRVNCIKTPLSFFPKLSLGTKLFRASGFNRKVYNPRLIFTARDKKVQLSRARPLTTKCVLSWLEKFGMTPEQKDGIAQCLEISHVCCR